jgi:glyoxylase-like metal-dependent hydrolase (beta-lactamase superfamily II)
MTTFFVDSALQCKRAFHVESPDAVIGIQAPAPVASPDHARLSSLERVAALVVRRVLPGRGEPLAGAAGRAAELIGHHERRRTRLESRWPTPTSGVR